MHLLRHPEYCPDSLRGAVLAIGNFDGLHRGHQAILQQVKALANAANKPAGLLTFEPHPVSVFSPSGAPMRLTPFRQKMQKLAAAGLDTTICLHFTRGFATLSAEDFIHHLLYEQLRVSHIVIGQDFTFGYKRTGNAALLQQLAPRYNFKVSVLQDITHEGIRFSSSRIRAHIQAGDIRAANAELGYGYSISGRVRKGEQRGAALLNCPTANLALKDALHPRYGVYITESTYQGRCYPSITHIGVNSTFGGQKAVAETHILDFNGNLYGQRLEVRLLEFLREEVAFSGIEALKTQIEKDIAQATTYVKRPPL